MEPEMRLENLRSERTRYGALFVILAIGLFGSHLRDGYLSDDFQYVVWARRSLTTLLAHLTISSYPQVLRPLPALAWLLSRLASGPSVKLKVRDYVSVFPASHGRGVVP